MTKLEYHEIQRLLLIERSRISSEGVKHYNKGNLAKRDSCINDINLIDNALSSLSKLYIGQLAKQR